MTASPDPLLETLGASWLHAVIDALPGRNGVETSEVYARLAASLSINELVLPVVGVQGAGKSTLLNALLFDDPVLPTDVDETTCVPTEIRWGETRTAEVEFRDGRCEPIEATDEGLSALVHNEHNPGNRWGVSRVRVQTPDPLLRTGITLVDLPGLGSLTPENQRTTHEYLRSCAAVLVLLRTSPPLTGHEATVVGGIWPIVPRLMFAQNRWTVESAAEANEGHEYNVYKLRELSKTLRIGLADDEPKVFVACAYEAWADRLQNGGLAAELEPLRDELQGWASSWRCLLRSGVEARVGEDVAEATLAARRDRDRLTKDEADLRAERAELRARFGRFRADLKRRRNAGLDEIEEATANLMTFAGDWRTRTRQELRNAMRAKIRGGIVDGVHLDAAFAQEQRERMDELLEHCSTAVADLRDDLMERFGDLPDWDPSRTFDGEGPGLSERLKPETHLPQLLGAAGGIAAFAAAGGGAKIGAALGATAGPVGMIVGAVAGAIVGFSGYVAAQAVGKGIKHLVSTQRHRRAESAVFPLIEEFTDEAYEGLKEQAEEVEEQFGRTLDGWLKQEQARFDTQEALEQKARALSAAEKVAEADRLEGILVRLESVAKSLGDSK